MYRNGKNNWNGKSAIVLAKKYDFNEYQQLRCSRIKTPLSKGKVNQQLSLPRNMISMSTNN